MGLPKYLTNEGLDGNALNSAVDVLRTKQAQPHHSMQTILWEAIKDYAERAEESDPSHASLVEEVERLRTALTTFVDEYVEMVNSGDCGFWDPEKEDKVVAARKALERPNA